MRSFIQSARLAPVWLVARIWLGYEWITAGWDKVTDPTWVGAEAGTAVHGFLEFATSPPMTTGEHPAVASWWAAVTENVLLPLSTPISYLVAFGELFAGIALVLGLFTVVAAAGGALLNFLFLMSGSTGTGLNPEMLVLQIALIAAGAAAYRYGLDTIVQPRLAERMHTRKFRRQLDTIEDHMPVAGHGRTPAAS